MNDALPPLAAKRTVLIFICARSSLHCWLHRIASHFEHNFTTTIRGVPTTEASQRGVRGDANTCWQCRMPLEYSSRRHPVHLKYRQIVGRPGLRYGPPGIAHIGPQTPSWWGGAGCPPRLAALRTLLNTTISNQFLL